MDTLSKHLLVDIWLDEDLHSSHLEKIKKVIDQNLTVVKKVEHQFEPAGETIVWILSESHFSIHTYPEHNYLSLDIYICNESVDLQMICQKILDGLKIKKVQKRCLRRGELNADKMEDLF